MKKLYLFLILVFISCNKTKENNMETSKNEKLIKTYFEYFNNHDWEKMG